MQTPDRIADRDSPDSDEHAREYRPAVRAIVDAVISSRRYKSHPQSIPEESSRASDKTESNFESPEIDASSRRNGWRILRERQRRAGGIGKRVTPVERIRRLEDMKHRGDVAAYNNSRLAARLEILDTFIDNALSDDVLLGRQEMNPWRFRRNENLHRKWRFVHNAIVTQELLEAINAAKKRKAEEEEKGSQVDTEKRCSPDGESLTSQIKETPRCGQIKADHSSYTVSREDLLAIDSSKIGLKNYEDTQNVASRSKKERTPEQFTKADISRKSIKQTSDAPLKRRTLELSVDSFSKGKNNSADNEPKKSETDKSTVEQNVKEKPRNSEQRKLRKDPKIVAKPRLQNVRQPIIPQSSVSTAPLSASKKRNKDSPSPKRADVPKDTKPAYQLPSLTKPSNQRNKDSPSPKRADVPKDTKPAYQLLSLTKPSNQRNKDSPSPKRADVPKDTKPAYQLLSLTKPSNQRNKDSPSPKRADVPKDTKPAYQVLSMTKPSNQRNKDSPSPKRADVPKDTKPAYQVLSLTKPSNQCDGKTPNEGLTSTEDSNESGSSSTSYMSAAVILGFGSHHRMDTCDYCGRYGCPGMRNRGRNRKDKQTGPGSHLDDRRIDMEGIYDTSHKASERCERRLVKRMNQLGL